MLVRSAKKTEKALHRLVVVAVGGNALQPAGAGSLPADLERAARVTAGDIVGGMDGGTRRVCLVSGNGPQVGALFGAQLDSSDLSSCVAETEGLLGAVLARACTDAIGECGWGAGNGGGDSPSAPRVSFSTAAVAVTTHTLVDTDEALASAKNPTKPIGRYLRTDAEVETARKQGHVVKQEQGKPGPRVVVSSPRPIQIVESPAVRHLLADVGVVIASCGGGVPVIRRPGSARLERVEGVIDKDLAAAVLAEELQAESLVILTDVDGLFDAFGTPEQKLVKTLTADEAMARVAALPKGSMGPKVEACVKFVSATKRSAHIGKLGCLEDIVAGRAGTTINP